MKMDEFGDSIIISIVRGGFILTYPSDAGRRDIIREVLPTQRKLNQRIKELIERMSYVEN